MPQLVARRAYVVATRRGRNYLVLAGLLSAAHLAAVAAHLAAVAAHFAAVAAHLAAFAVAVAAHLAAVAAHFTAAPAAALLTKSLLTSTLPAAIGHPPFSGERYRVIKLGRISANLDSLSSIFHELTPCWTGTKRAAIADAGALQSLVARQAGASETGGGGSGSAGAAGDREWAWAPRAIQRAILEGSASIGS